MKGSDSKGSRIANTVLITAVACHFYQVNSRTKQDATQITPNGLCHCTAVEFSVVTKQQATGSGPHSVQEAVVRYGHLQQQNLELCRNDNRSAASVHDVTLQSH